jgi:S1-C subfamily serine protease
MRVRPYTTTLFGFISLIGYSICHSDEVASKGQEILDKNQHAVVTLKLVIKSSYSKDGQTSEPSETKYEISGTVLDSSGLTVLALSACDPAEFYKQVVPAYSAYKIQSEISDLKILLDDNREIPAEVVLRDKDLDLAFVRPKAKVSEPMTAVDFRQGVSAKVLEQVIAVNRLNSASARTYSASVERIIAVIKRPRLFYLHDGSYVGTSLGCPVFSLSGDLLGIVVMRVGGTSGDDYRQNAASIILPADQIFKTAKQAVIATDQLRRSADPTKKEVTETKPSK